MTFTLPPHRPEFTVSTAAVILADGMRYSARLGDVEARGHTPDEAKANLWVRLNDLRLELLRFGTLGQAHRERRITP